MRIRTRLLLSFAAIVCACGLISLFLVRGSAETLFRSFAFSGDSEKAEVYARILEGYYAGQGGWDGLQDFLSGMPAYLVAKLDERIEGPPGPGAVPAFSPRTIGALLSDRIAVADGQGRIVADSSGKLLGSVHPAEHLSHGVPVLSGQARVGTVLVGSMIDSTFTGASGRFLSGLLRSVALAILASTALSLVLALALSIRITRPLAALDRAVRRVATGDLSPLVPVSGTGEIASLSASFNAMTAELGRLEEAKRRIIADSAHELRTPVTLIRGSLEAMLDGVYPLDEAGIRGVHEETLRLSRLIDTLRELETIDSGRLKLEMAEADLGAMAAKAAALFKARAGEKSIALETVPPGSPVVARVDPLRFGEVVYNLIDNAMKYSPRGGRVELRVGLEDGRPALRVEDSGPGIPAAERERVFERFYRTDKSRAQDSGGRGLGLSIAFEIVKAHGGTIDVGQSALGGAAFVVRLPGGPARGAGDSVCIPPRRGLE
jgi:signal transduction histidine kinase